MIPSPMGLLRLGVERYLSAQQRVYDWVLDETGIYLCWIEGLVVALQSALLATPLSVFGFLLAGLFLMLACLMILLPSWICQHRERYQFFAMRAARAEPAACLIVIVYVTEALVSWLITRRPEASLFFLLALVTHGLFCVRVRERRRRPRTVLARQNAS